VRTLSPVTPPDPAGQPPLSWLLGTHHKQRLRLQRTLLAGLVYLLASVAIVLSEQAGLVDAMAGSTVVLYLAAGFMLFVAMIRSGLSLAFADPALTLPQLLHGLGGIVLCYTLIPVGRSLTLPLLSLAMTFALLSRLSPRQTMYCGLIAAVMMVGAFVLTSGRGAGHGDITQEGFNLIMAALTLPIFTSVSRQVKEWRNRLQAQRDELQALIGELRALAVKDPLTGLSNRRAMNAALLEELLRYRRHQRPFCVAILDVDDFKSVNDTFGHHEGDRVLVALSHHLATHFPGPDQVARWGGEEFIVLFPEERLDAIVAWLETARQGLHIEVGVGTPQARRVTCSFGVTQSQPLDDPTAILTRADAALYEAKRAGKNQVLAA